MANWIETAIIAGIAILVIIVVIVMIIRARYKIFRTNEFVIHFRKGKVLSAGYGGSFFKFPIIDDYVVLSTAIQQVDIAASEKVITKENQEVIVRGILVWRITDAEEAYKAIGVQQGVSAMAYINMTLEQIVESIIRTTVAKLSIDEVLRERSTIVEAIIRELESVVGGWGISIETCEIKDVQVLNNELFQNLQAEFENKARLNAQETKIFTDMEIAKKTIEKEKQVKKMEALKEQEVRTFQAEQEEIAKKRELEKDKLLVLKQQEVELALQEKEKNVGRAAQLKEKEVGEIQLQKEIEFTKLQKQREVTEAELQKKRITIEAEADVVKKEKAAQALKIQKVLTEIEVEAERARKQAQAEAEALRMRAEARAMAARIEAEAEAEKMKMIAEAKKKQLLAEAEGRKAILLAEAEGLRKKVEAQNQITEAAIMQELINELPKIAESIKIGDVSWLNLGAGDNKSPLSIVSKNFMELMALSQHFGLDLQGMISKLKNDNHNNVVTQTASAHPLPADETLTNTLEPTNSEETSDVLNVSRKSKRVSRKKS